MTISSSLLEETLPSTVADADGCEYDLLVDRSEISGLSTLDAYHTVNPKAKILVLESHPTQLGGHEYTVEVDSNAGG